MSRFATYHITNDEVWEKVKSGEFKGYSLAGVFKEVEFSEVEDDITEEEYNEIMGLINDIKEALNK